MDRASADVRVAAEQVEVRRARLANLERAQARRLSFDIAEGWREAKAAEVSEVLAHHWAEATLAVARQGDPLAFGTERLREARATYSADLDRLDASLPPDAADRLRRAEAALCRAQEAHGRAALGVKEAEQGLTLASQRRWGRIDRPARDAALHRRTMTTVALHGKEGSLEQARQELAQAQAVQASHERALAATAPERHELSQAVADLGAAVVRTRPERAVALVNQEVTPAHLVETLGPVPEGPWPRAVWWALAAEVEDFHDRHPGRKLDEKVDRWDAPGLHADQERLHDLLARAPELVAAGDQLSVDMDSLRQLCPGGWAAQLEQADALAHQLPDPAPELGMDIGW